jgi:ribosome maturation factor RimP
MTQREKIASALAPIIEASGNFLEDLIITSAGKHRILTVVVDGEKHLTLDQVTTITKSLSEVLENLSEIGDLPFTLEVTSPGVDRPLTLPRHWRKNFGRLINLTFNDGTKLTGRIGESSESDVLIGESKINFADIKKATIEIEFK